MTSASYIENIQCKNNKVKYVGLTIPIYNKLSVNKNSAICYTISTIYYFDVTSFLVAISHVNFN